MLPKIRNSKFLRRSDGGYLPIIAWKGDGDDPICQVKSEGSVTAENIASLKLARERMT